MCHSFRAISKLVMTATAFEMLKNGLVSNKNLCEQCDNVFHPVAQSGADRLPLLLAVTFKIELATAQRLICPHCRFYV